ncbi:MAG TPA: hypothetical protein VK187_02735 [Geobacteraceae bacterium]|nr:hypothetical protein [Geobacteraceae bacterium]
MSATEAHCQQPALKRLHKQMALSCHDPQLMSSLAFGREWYIQVKLFCVRGFAGLKIAAFLSGSAAPAIGGSSIAATAAAPKGAVSSDALQTCVISGASKESSITGTASVPTGNGWPHPA